MGLSPLYNYWKDRRETGGVYPPAYYAVDEATYAKIIHYYIQDIVCLGHERIMEYASFVEKLDGHPNIYNDSAYTFVPSEP